MKKTVVPADRNVHRFGRNRNLDYSPIFVPCGHPNWHTDVSFKATLRQVNAPTAHSRCTSLFNVGLYVTQLLSQCFGNFNLVLLFLFVIFLYEVKHTWRWDLILMPVHTSSKTDPNGPIGFAFLNTICSAKFSTLWYNVSIFGKKNDYFYEVVKCI